MGKIGLCSESEKSFWNQIDYFFSKQSNKGNFYFALFLFLKIYFH